MLQQTFAALVEPPQAAQEEVLDAVGDPRQGIADVAIWADVAQNLLDEEGVPLRALDNRSRDRRRGRAGQLRSDQLRDFALAETAERDGGERARAAQFRDCLSERVCLVDLGLPVGPKDQQRAALGGADDVPQEQQRGDVGPVKVIQHQDQRMLFRDRAQQRRDAVEQLELLTFGGPARRARGRLRRRIGKLGNQPGEDRAMPAHLEAELIERGFGDMVPERLNERLVRDDRVLVAAPE